MGIGKKIDVKSDWLQYVEQYGSNVAPTSPDRCPKWG